ncbi:hypothetical protein GJ744_006132 [Endocarpon pusillum]|uniref:Uncharacterized protein n=1 Tax=Endocarpon pusillum TaxID=364733 RepID=A0A8H7A704_9EURO|nr:hypothetical protein GJ744_006132 [Endocarpon pusillum]
MSWLIELAPKCFQTPTYGTLSQRKKAERIQPLYRSTTREDDWRLSTQRKNTRGGGGGTWG